MGDDTTDVAILVVAVGDDATDTDVRVAVPAPRMTAIMAVKINHRRDTRASSFIANRLLHPPVGYIDMTMHNVHNCLNSAFFGG